MVYARHLKCRDLWSCGFESHLAHNVSDCWFLLKSGMSQKSSQLKTRYIAYIAVTIDGRISLSHTSKPDWTSKEDWEFFQHGLAQAGAVVVGRNTYNVAAERLRKRNTFVLTSRVKKTLRKGTVTFVNPKNVDLRNIFSIYKTIAVIGGSSVYQHMLEHDMLDELYLSIEPIIFGRGIEMFVGGNENKKMKLVSVKKLNKQGTILLHYLSQS